jgi:hypothetical protein
MSIDNKITLYIILTNVSGWVLLLNTILDDYYTPYSAQIYYYIFLLSIILFFIGIYNIRRYEKIRRLWIVLKDESKGMPWDNLYY